LTSKINKMKTLVRIITAVSFLFFGISTQSTAQSQQSIWNLNIDFEGTLDLSLNDDFQIVIYNGLMKELLKDDLIKSKKSFSFEFEDDSILVDDRKLKGRNYQKYRDILEEDMGDPKQFKMVWKRGKLVKFQIRTK